MTDWKEALAKIAQKNFGITLTPHQETAQMNQTELPINQINHISPGRQAHAPYNFIPLNEIVIPSPDKPGEGDCAFDRYHDGRYTGYIELGIETKTPLYIRDTLTEKEMQEKEEIEKDPRKKYLNPEFFSPADKIRIPGSSLRGTVRAMVEIVSCSKIQFVNNSRFFYRALADKDLDLRRQYQGKMVSEFPNVIPEAKAGYIIKVPEEMVCKIKPAKPLKSFGGATYFRINQNIVSRTFHDVVSMQNDNYNMKRGEVFFKPTNPDSIPKYHDHHGGLKMWYGMISHELKSVDNPPPKTEDGWEKGWLICSGGMNNKKMHYIVTEPDDVRDDQLITINQ